MSPACLLVSCWYCFPHAVVELKLLTMLTASNDRAATDALTYSLIAVVAACRGPPQCPSLPINTLLPRSALELLAMSMSPSPASGCRALLKSPTALPLVSSQLSSSHKCAPPPQPCTYLLGALFVFVSQGHRYPAPQAPPEEGAGR
jgi:hypothetical protein